MSYNHSTLLSRRIPAAPQHHLQYDHGTRVTVHDLFGKMPVRVKQRTINIENPRRNSKEWEDLVSRILRVLLCWPKNPGIVIMRNKVTNHKLVLQLPVSQVGREMTNTKIFYALRQASFIPAEDMASWVSVEASGSGLSISGTVSLRPHPNKRCQFLSFGIHPILPEHSYLYDEINKHFSNSNFGTIDTAIEVGEVEERRRKDDRRYNECGYTLKELRSRKKGVDKWPKFYLNIKSENFKDTLISGLQNDIWRVSEGTNNKIKQLLQKMMWQLLKDHNFCPRQVSEASSNRQSSLKTPIAEPIWQSEHQNLSSKRLSDFASTSALQNQGMTNVQIQKLNNPSISNKNKGICKMPFQPQSKIKFGITPNASPTAKHVCNLKLNKIHMGQENLDLSSIGLHSTGLAQKKCLMSEINQSMQLYVPEESQDLDEIIEDTKIQNEPCTSLKVIGIKANPVQLNSSHSKKNPVYNTTSSLTNPQTIKIKDLNMPRGLIAAPSKHNLAPLLPVCCPQSLSSSDAQKNPSSWITHLLQSWRSPIYLPAEQAIRRAHLINTSYTRAGNSDSQIPSRLESEIDIACYVPTAYRSKMNRISKQALRKAKFIAQVDRKFILVKLPVDYDETSVSLGERLVIIDQHAADERIRIESLLEELCKPNPVMSPNSPCPIRTHILVKPLTFQLPYDELELFSTYQPYFCNWGILYNLSVPGKSSKNSQFSASVTVTSLPPLIVERCQSQPHLVISLLRTEIWRIHESQSDQSLEIALQACESSSWVDRVHKCPINLRDLLNARACRCAIMFNDELSRDQCLSLIYQLAECYFPFQCAHGRPSMVPLVEFMAINSLTNIATEINENYETISAQYQSSFLSQFKKWREQL